MTARAEVSTEAFIRDAASRGLSKAAVRETLGISRDSFKLILELMPDVAWVGPNQSLGRKLAYEAQRGVCSPARCAALEAARSNLKRLRSHEVDGRVGTINELAAHYPVSANTVRRRMQEGMTLHAALNTPPMPAKACRMGLPGRSQGERRA